MALTPVQGRVGAAECEYDQSAFDTLDTLTILHMLVLKWLVPIWFLLKCVVLQGQIRGQVSVCRA